MQAVTWKSKAVELRRGVFAYADTSLVLGRSSSKTILLHRGFCLCGIVSQVRL
jgi:hypothetical protein